MPAVAPYIPPKDANLSTWAQNFSDLITASPGTYGLTAADALNIKNAVDPFQAAYALVTSPMTKTANTVSAKNDARVTMLSTIRPYSQQVALNPGVASSDKISLGLNPRTSTPQPVSAPVTNPVLSVQGAGNLSLILRYRDSAASVSVKSKPFGVISCEIYGLVSATPVTDPAAMFHIASATKSPLTITRAAGDGAKQLYLAARWKTRKGLTSPWSPIINFTVPAAT